MEGGLFLPRQIDQNAGNSSDQRQVEKDAQHLELGEFRIRKGSGFLRGGVQQPGAKGQIEHGLKEIKETSHQNGLEEDKTARIPGQDDGGGQTTIF